MRQRMKNDLEIRLDGINLNDYTNLKFFVSQRDVEFSFTGSVNASNNSVMNVTIPKSAAVALYPGPALIQVAITNNSTGEILTHDPIEINVGKLLWEGGYGS